LLWRRKEYTAPCQRRLVKGLSRWWQRLREERFEFEV
jgi:hypothetical protein